MEYYSRESVDRVPCRIDGPLEPKFDVNAMGLIDDASSGGNRRSTTPSSESVNDTMPIVPVAVCGMAMRLPGGIASEEQIWDFLVNKRSARDAVPQDRYNAAAFHDRDRYGYFLHDIDLQKFDASLFSITRSELECLDPQVRLMLELTRCLRNRPLDPGPSC